MFLRSVDQIGILTELKMICHLRCKSIVTKVWQGVFLCVPLDDLAKTSSRNLYQKVMANI